jgi:hypothetical protein
MLRAGMGELADEARRLALASALNRHARERAEEAADAAGLLVAGRSLAEGIGAFEERHHVRFAPAYPGVVAGPAGTAGRARVLFACSALRPDGHTVGTVFTTLIAGRPPTVSVGPPGARVH